MARTQRCSVDGQLMHVKPCSVYWRWRYPSGDERGYKQVRCVEHSASIAYMCSRAAKNVQDCTHCFGPFSEADRVQTVWATVYFPNRERIDAYADFHENCFVLAEPDLMAGALRLPDRPQGSRPPTQAPAVDPWKELVDGLPEFI